MNQSAQEKANMHYNDIVEKMERLQKISADLVTDSGLNWGHVGSLAYISNTLGEVLEGFEGETE